MDDPLGTLKILDSLDARTVGVSEEYHEQYKREARQKIAQALKMQDEDGHVWLPHPSEPAAEVCWRCRCLKMHGTDGRIKYRAGFIPFLLNDRPPSPCRRNRKSDCPI